MSEGCLHCSVLCDCIDGVAYCSDYKCVVIILFFFFFQAEDGIRDIGVTGVQTCALPIFAAPALLHEAPAGALLIDAGKAPGAHRLTQDGINAVLAEHARAGRAVVRLKRSEERRVGKEWRSRWSPYH